MVLAKSLGFFFARFGAALLSGSIVAVIGLLLLFVFVVLRHYGSSELPSSILGVWSTQAPDRNNLTILYTYLSTVFLCTHTVCHPDISGGPNRVPHRVWWFLIGLVAPEFIAVMAMSQFFRVVVLVHEQAQSRTHLTVLNGWSYMHWFYADMGGFLLEHESLEGAERLSSQRIIELCEKGHANCFDITKENIADRSKADWLTKLITLGQVGWFLTLFVVRSIYYTPSGTRSTGITAVSTLELTTTGFVATAIVSSISWYHKPLAIATQTIVRIPSERTPDFRARDEGIPMQPYSQVRGVHEYSTIDDLDDSNDVSFKVALLRQVKGVTSKPQWVLGKFLVPFSIGLVSCLFGGIHMIALISEYYFPTDWETQVWLAASGSTTALPLGIYILYYGPLQYRGSGEAGSSRWTTLLVWLEKALRFLILWPACLLYTASRIFLLAEPFLGLRTVDPNLYNAITWSTVVPFIH